MFSLIITILSIALVAALALATIYYGGPALKNHQANAAAARIANEGQQLQGSLTLHKSETGVAASSMDDLVARNYLASAPKGWEMGEGFVFQAESSYQVCLAANKKLGLDSVPDCSDANYASQPVCCTTAAEPT